MQNAEFVGDRLRSRMLIMYLHNESGTGVSVKIS